MSVGHRACSAVSSLVCSHGGSPQFSVGGRGKAGAGGTNVSATSTWLPECVLSEVFTNISGGVQRQSSFSKEATERAR